MYIFSANLTTVTSSNLLRGLVPRCQEDCGQHAMDRESWIISTNRLGSPCWIWIRQNLKMQNELRRVLTASSGNAVSEIHQNKIYDWYIFG